LHRLNNGGFINKWFNDNAFAGTLKNRLEVEYEEPELQLKLQDLNLAFFTLFSGYALAFLAFLAELLIPKRFVLQ
ncbi:hypothetical protein NPIL_33091, partial [Nephila pilipes]